MAAISRHHQTATHFLLAALTLNANADDAVTVLDETCGFGAHVELKSRIAFPSSARQSTKARCGIIARKGARMARCVTASGP